MAVQNKRDSCLCCGYGENSSHSPQGKTSSHHKHTLTQDGVEGEIEDKWKEMDTQILPLTTASIHSICYLPFRPS